MCGYNNLAWGAVPRTPTKSMLGISGFGPNLNIVRDPRFGRNSELPGERPFLNGQYAKRYVSGMQQSDSRGHPLMLAYVKHLDAYSTENTGAGRGHDNYRISLYDFFDSYLPAYKAAFQEGNASGAMCSYNAENGHPSCANGWLLNDVLRKRWDQEDTLITTDCGAVTDVMNNEPLKAGSKELASAWTINNSTDLEMGDEVWAQGIPIAVKSGLVSEATIDQSVRRTLLPLFWAGIFDEPKTIGWLDLGAKDIGSDASRQIQQDAAAQGMVLLKNEKRLLPLKAGQKIAIIGPMATNHDLFSCYAQANGFAGGCFPGNNNSCSVTIGGGIAALNTGGMTSITAGVGIDCKPDGGPLSCNNQTAGIAPAVALAKSADVVVLVLGNDRSVEREGLDRTNTTLEGIQSQLATAVLAAGVPTLLILSNGGAIAFDELIEGSDAIVEAFNPGFGSPALADLLFGRSCKWGKLPVTRYPASYQTEQPMLQYAMSAAPGCTYRYYTGKPLFSFGDGLSLTTFGHRCACVALACSCTIENTGGMAGDEVLMVYDLLSAAIRHTVGALIRPRRNVSSTLSV